MSRITVAHAVAPDLSRLAGAIGDPVRIAMLFALLDGRELAAFELAGRAGASPQAASAHLRKLVESGLLVARRSGRLHMFGLASKEVAHAVESLASLAPAPKIASLGEHTRLQRLRVARSCYDHLAGRLGVAVMDAMERGAQIAEKDGALRLTRRGVSFTRELGIDLDRYSGRRALLRRCLDWTERRDHLAGTLGAAMLAHFLHDEWLKRSQTDRALQITPRGAAAFADLFDINVEFR